MFVFSILIVLVRQFTKLILLVVSYSRGTISHFYLVYILVPALQKG